ncbi:MAG: DNA polymerase sliding clamp [Desulfurococcales archaeon]|nr:DNA polymerase sliding clamp [Desulfurococcales archaeon]
MSEEYVVELEHPSAKTFVTILEALGNIVDEALFSFTNDGVVVKALDPAKVALIEIKIPPEAFLTFKVTKDLSVGMNLSSLIKSISKPKKTDKLTFRANEQFYELIVEGVAVKRYKYRSVEVSATEVPEVTLDFKVRALVLAQAFKAAVKDLKGVGSIAFVAEDDQNLYLRAAEGGAEAKLSKMGGSILEMEVSEPSRCVYDEDYITKILNLTGIAENLEIKFGNDLPLRLSFNLVDGGSVNYLLAPKA